MDKDNITINFFPIEIVAPVVDFYTSNQRPLILHNEFLPTQLIKLSEINIIPADYKFWSFEEFPGSKKISMDSLKDLNITKKYITLILYKYFAAINSFYVRHNFIGAIELFEKGGCVTYENNELQLLKTFTIRCEYWDSTKRFGIIVSKGRDTYCTVKPYSFFKAKIPFDRINRILFNNRVGYYSEFSGTAGFNDDAFYLLRSNMLGDIFPIYRRGYQQENKYLGFHREIISFIKRYLFEKDIAGFVRFPYSQLMAVPKNDIFRTSRESNLLSFRHDQTTFNVYNGLKEFGPSFIPEGTSNIKYMFIFHQDDNTVANNFLSYIVKGYRGFPGFSQFVGIPISMESVDKTKTIRYTKDNPLDEILQNINGLDFSDGQYVAFYLSRISKDELDFEKRKVYFKVKEALLSKGVVSQVIDKEKLSDPYYNFYLPNIAIALLAKLSGIPWKLAHPASPDLIVGIGATKEANNIFFGNTICFKNDGTFKEFDAFLENDLVPLGNAFKNSIQSYVQENPDAKRLVIHFYKIMSEREERRLLNVLSDLNILIPYVVLTITDNPSKDYVIFDEEFDGLMPVSGTYVRIRKNIYLLANNQRYENTTTLKISDFPFPVKIHFSKSRDVDLKDSIVINGLIYQVYQFSRIYWRSIRQKAKPVTILYSKIIAEMVSCFSDEKLPKNVVSHTRLWFL